MDTVYWVAIVRPGDQWQGAANRAKSELGNVRLLTTDEVLSEFVTILGGGGEALRRQAAKMVAAILADANVKVVPQSRDSFLKGIHLYRDRADKQYSLTDCISMNAMRAESVNDVLTNDHHFEQEGFRVLMLRS